MSQIERLPLHQPASWTESSPDDTKKWQGFCRAIERPLPGIELRVTDSGATTTPQPQDKEHLSFDNEAD